MSLYFQKPVRAVSSDSQLLLPDCGHGPAVHRLPRQPVHVHRAPPLRGRGHHGQARLRGLLSAQGGQGGQPQNRHEDPGWARRGNQGPKSKRLEKKNETEIIPTVSRFVLLSVFFLHLLITAISLE